MCQRLWVIALLPMILISATGCTATAPKVVTVTEIVEVYVDRYVPVDKRLVEPVEIAELPPRSEWDALTGQDKLIVIGTLYRYQKVRAQVCNMQLNEIAGLGSDNPVLVSGESETEQP